MFSDEWLAMFNAHKVMVRPHQAPITRQQAEYLLSILDEDQREVILHQFDALNPAHETDPSLKPTPEAKQD